MSSCVRCGSQEGEDGRYARVLTESEIIKKNGRRVREIRETLVDIAHVAVCPRCARRKKWKEVLLTIPITLALTAGMTFMGLFAVRPNRNIRQEVASMPTVLPLVAAAAGLLGSSGWGGAFGLLCGILCDAALGGGGLLFTVALTVMGFLCGFLGDFILARGFPS